MNGDSAIPNPIIPSTPMRGAVNKTSELQTRDDRQTTVAEWCAAAFGADHQASVPQRGLRMLEEAIEAYQATAGNAGTAHKLIDYIFAKEPGELVQELGGLGVTVLALAAAAGLSADEAETREVNRVLSKPLEWFHARNKVKNDAGFDATAYPVATPAPEPQPEVAADLIERCAAQIEPGLWPMMDEHDRNLHRAIAKRILALANPPVVEEAVKAETEALLDALKKAREWVELGPELPGISAKDEADARQTLAEIDAAIARSAAP